MSATMQNASMPATISIDNKQKQEYELACKLIRNDILDLKDSCKYLLQAPYQTRLQGSQMLEKLANEGHLQSKLAYGKMLLSQSIKTYLNNEVVVIKENFDFACQYLRELKSLHNEFNFEIQYILGQAYVEIGQATRVEINQKTIFFKENIQYVRNSAEILHPQDQMNYLEKGVQMVENAANHGLNAAQFTLAGYYASPFLTIHSSNIEKKLLEGNIQARIDNVIKYYTQASAGYTNAYHKLAIFCYLLSQMHYDILVGKSLTIKYQIEKHHDLFQKYSELSIQNYKIFIDTLAKEQSEHSLSTCHHDLSKLESMRKELAKPINTENETPNLFHQYNVASKQHVEKPKKRKRSNDNSSERPHKKEKTSIFPLSPEDNADNLPTQEHIRNNAKEIGIPLKR